jgi:type I restriction enzyme S subunit
MSSKTKTRAVRDEATPSLIPKLRFPEFQGTSGWSVASLSEFATIVMGSSPKSEYYNQNEIGLPLLQGNADIKNRLSAPRIYTSEITKECTIGDILLSVRAPVGSVAKSAHHACIGRGIAAVRADHPNNQEFVYQWLLSYESQWVDISQGGTFDAVNSDDLKGVALAVPRPAEQQNIASCLSSLDSLITAHTQKLNALKTYKKGLMQQLFPREGETVPRLRFPEFRGDGEWETGTLGELADYENGKAFEQDIVDDGKYVVVNSRFISTDGKVRKYTNADHLIAKAGEVLMVLSDLPKGRALAKCYFVDSNDRYAVNQRVCRIKPRQVDGRFLYYTLNRHPNLLAYDDGLNQTHLSKGGVTGCQIRLPMHNSEQQRIASCLTNLDDLIAAQTQKLEGLKTHKKGLMRGLFPNVIDP